MFVEVVAELIVESTFSQVIEACVAVLALMLKDFGLGQRNKRLVARFARLIVAFVIVRAPISIDSICVEVIAEGVEVITFFKIIKTIFIECAFRL